eukprot:4098383-Pyramimonas_sp.AAC.1
MLCCSRACGLGRTHRAIHRHVVVLAGCCGAQVCATRWHRVVHICVMWRSQALAKLIVIQWESPHACHGARTADVVLCCCGTHVVQSAS